MNPNHSIALAGPLTRDTRELPSWPATTQQRPPESTGPPTVEEIIALMRIAGGRPEGLRLRGVVVVLWRAELPDQQSARTGRE